MENRGLLFIPDISGFTRFITETEIEHSRLIIQELLEVLIECNQLDLKISEVEGDAILFYRYGDSPNLEAIYKQVEKMFYAFHRSLYAYEYRRFCMCKACNSAIKLTLKVITHYGEFTGYTIQNFNKLIGKDVIVAHQLLKNDIPQHEYWLVTDNLLNDGKPNHFAKWMEWNSSAKQTETGEIPFHYTQLSELKNEIPLDPLPQAGLSEKTKMFTLSKEYDRSILTMFHAAGDFNLRHRWQQGVQKVEQVTHLLPRIGMRCRRIMDNGQDSIYITSYSYHPDRIEFSETDEKTNNTLYYTLEKIDPTKTRLTLDYYVKKNALSKLQFSLFQKKKTENWLTQSMNNLVLLAKEMKEADEP